ncbi:MAG: penicillin-binding protein 2 [Puniceicoccales bacterium]|nr:penicillin-binding protein 2 [Puniceicoccales bacterium]
MKQIHFQANNRRIVILGVFFLLVFLFLSCGLFYRQIVQHDYFCQKEKRQNQRRIILPAPRGNIYDRNGKLLVCNSPSFELQLYFDDIRTEVRREYSRLMKEWKTEKKSDNRTSLQKKARQNVVEKYLALANAITGRNHSIDTKNLERHYRESLLLPITILADLSQREYIQLIDRLPPQSPLYIAPNYYRFYPYQSAACHVLGYVVPAVETTHATSLKTFQFLGKTGKTGIELSQNQSLSGTHGEQIFSVDPSGFRADCIQEKYPRKGQDCILSIDIDLQMAAEYALGNKLGSAIVLDIHSGEVLAMASKPDYNVNLLSPKITTEVYKKITDSGAWLNRTFQGVYPPASTFKIISTIAFLRHKVASWNRDDTIECPGYTTIGSRIFNCDHSTAHGIVSLRPAIEKSCNVYFYLRSQNCGIEKIAEEAKRFHLDQKTGIELPFETNRMAIPSPAWKEKKGYGKWFAGDTTNTSIGQGYLLVSPLQMACFTASLAKNRTQTIPHILHDRTHTQPSTPEIGLDKQDYESLIRTLQSVINSGTGRLAKLDRATLAGKSGTAQVWDHGEKRNVAWFIGFAPVENPKVAIAIAVQEQSQNDNYYGGKTAAPIARQILNFYFKEKEP